MPNKMPNIFDVANYILDSVGQISTLKLQKLTYYCQAWSLAWTHKPLFKEDFQAWSNGPVNPELFNYFQGEIFIYKNKINKRKLTYTLTSEDIEKINTVLEYYGELSGNVLSSFTRTEKPWKNARKDVPAGVSCSKIITKKSIEDFYSALLFEYEK